MCCCLFHVCESNKRAAAAMNPRTCKCMHACRCVDVCHGGEFGQYSILNYLDKLCRCDAVLTMFKLGTVESEQKRTEK